MSASAAMALKAVHAADVPSLHHLHKDAVPSSSSCISFRGDDGVRASLQPSKFLVIGHRGSGMNLLTSDDRRMKAIKENSIQSFNAAGAFSVDFVEFDVQVTKDDWPVIFHDNFILSEEANCTVEKRVTDLTLEEFLQYGPQGATGKAGKTLLRRTKDGSVFSWKVEDDHPFCTLQEAFSKVTPAIGFNIELKFDDSVQYEEHALVHVLQVVLQVVSECAHERPIFFSSFHPDAARIARHLQSVYPVFFLTNGGSELHTDQRRNSLAEAINWCLAHGLDGIVSEVQAVFRYPGEVLRIKEAKLSLLTYGQLNNMQDAVYMQYLMGVGGVIVDLVKEITEILSDFIKLAENGGEALKVDGGKMKMGSLLKTNLSQGDIL